MSPSYRIVFYVSGHGFGHTSRTVEVIRGVLRSRSDAEVIVKTSAPRHLYDGPLGHQISVIDLECDAGMIQVDSLDLDIAASLRHAKQFQARLPQLVHTEAAFLRGRSVRLVVGDIPPLAFAAADRAGVPSVAIGNFTWDWIYEAYPEESPDALVDDIRGMYRLAGTVLRLPLTGGFQGLESVARDIPFIARQSPRTCDEVRDALGLAARGQGKPVVLISFGRYGIHGLASDSVAALSDYTVISGQQLRGTALDYQDLVRAADVVVTKPGYGIISEAIANDTAILYTSRGRFPEYEVLVREMPRYVRAQFIEKDDLLRGNWQSALEKLLSRPPAPERPSINGAEVAAHEILRQG